MTEIRAAINNQPKIRLKYLFHEIDQRVGIDAADLPLLSVSIHRGVIPRAEMTDRESRADEFSGYKRVARGDIVINRMRAFEGGAGISSYDGMASADYAVLRTGEQLDPRFFHHLIRSKWFVGEMTARLRGIGSADLGNVRTPRINVEDLGDILVALPTTAEQRAVADYLHAETARLDRLIALSLRQRALNDERVRALVVCEMGRLASTHGTIPLRRLVTCLDGRRIPLNAEERAARPGDYPYYGASGVVDHVDDYLFDETLVLLGEDGAQLGDPAYPIAQGVTGKVWVNNHAHVLRPEGVDAVFLVFQLNSFDRMAVMSGATREKITQEDMGRIPIPSVSRDVQEATAATLGREATQVARLNEGLQKRIGLLLERRQALITAAVTGQIEIPGLAA